MPLVKKDWSVLEGHLWEMVVLGGSFLVIVLGHLLGWIPKEQGYWTMPLALFLAGVGLFRQQRRMRRLVCPTCGKVIRRENAKPGEVVAFHCEACDTIWETGFRESDGGD